MSNPTTAVEVWAKECTEARHRFHGDLIQTSIGLCSDCADAYARQQVEAFRERAAQLCDGRETGIGVDTGRIWRNTMRAQLAAAIRALTP